MRPWNGSKQSRPAGWQLLGRAFHPCILQDSHEWGCISPSPIFYLHHHDLGGGCFRYCRKRRQFFRRRWLQKRN
jgi:hypothetical protein